jgi:predicted nucleic-acid-binding protein
MKRYLLDVNLVLRFLLQDNLAQYREARAVFASAKANKMKIKLMSEVVMEAEYVLRKLYKVPRLVIAKKVSDILKNNYLEVEKKTLLLQSLRKYGEVNVIDLVDILLYFQAVEENCEILSFDKDFKKLAK